jgi:hypothetical protein
MWRLVAPLVAAVLLVIVAPAEASKPVAGGRYVSHVNSRVGPDFDVVLRLSNDGREFAQSSYVELETACMSGSIGLDSDEAYQLRSVPVRRNGGFDADEGDMGIKGRFVRRGRVAVGSIWVAADGRCPPRRIRIRFRARLRDRPEATRPGEIARCDRTAVGNRDVDPSRVFVAYDVRARGIGCTAARELARRWHADPRCASSVVGGGCSVAGASCQAVRGGVLNARAVTRCVPARVPAAAVELVRLLPCRSSGAVTWVINLDCETAGDVPLPVPAFTAETVEACGQLGRDTSCWRTNGYTCSLRVYRASWGSNRYGRCVLDQDRFKAFEYEYDQS